MSDHEYFGGIDIGLDGAIVLLRDGDIWMHWVMPTLKTGSAARNFDEGAIGMMLDTIEGMRPKLVLVEEALTISKGTAAIAKLHNCQGYIRGYLAASQVSQDSINPAKWKAAMGVSALKQSSVQAATRLWPQHKALFQPTRGERTKAQAEGVAEAALLAEYARRRSHA